MEAIRYTRQMQVVTRLTGMYLALLYILLYNLLCTRCQMLNVQLQQ